MVLCWSFRTDRVINEPGLGTFMTHTHTHLGMLTDLDTTSAQRCMLVKAGPAGLVIPPLYLLFPIAEHALFHTCSNTVALWQQARTHGQNTRPSCLVT